MESNIVIADTGPIIHLNEIKALELLSIFKKVLIPLEVANELKKNKISYGEIKVINVKRVANKDDINVFVNKYDLDQGESEAIALAKQEKINMIITDDLDARSVGKHLGFEVHGTLGILTRALVMKKISKSKTKKLVNLLYTNSSLFLTRELVNWAFNEIERKK